MYNKVFISYAKEDLETAEKLFSFLVRNSYSPWLDKVVLLPGQDWNTEIRLALKKADFIILLLSKTSVAKRGFVQREFKLALEFCEEKLDSDIYIIPCKIDDCEVPDKLLKYQWTELSKPDSFDLILNSLDHQRKKYEEYDKKKIAENTSFEFKEIKIEKIVGDKPKSNIEIVYPQFSDIENEDLKFLNNYIEHLIYESYHGFTVPHGEDLFPEEIKEVEFTDFPLLDYELQLSYKFELISKNFISITLFSYFYGGGAHGIYATSGYNFKLNPLKKITLDSLFDYDSTVLKTLKKICKHKLLKKAKEDYDIDNEEDFFLVEDPLELEWSTFDNFYLNKDSINIIFTVYQITAFVYGEHEVEIKFEDILKEHPSISTLVKVKKILAN